MVRVVVEQLACRFVVEYWGSVVRPAYFVSEEGEGERLRGLGYARHVNWSPYALMRRVSLLLGIFVRLPVGTSVQVEIQWIQWGLVVA